MGHGIVIGLKPQSLPSVVIPFISWVNTRPTLSLHCRNRKCSHTCSVCVGRSGSRWQSTPRHSDNRPGLSPDTAWNALISKAVELVMLKDREEKRRKIMPCNRLRGQICQPGEQKVSESVRETKKVTKCHNMGNNVTYLHIFLDEIYRKITNLYDLLLWNTKDDI